MFLMWIFPLLLIGLVVYAISGRNLTNILSPGAGRSCPHCGRAMQADWNNCPHCGQSL